MDDGIFVPENSKVMDDDGPVDKMKTLNSIRSSTNLPILDSCPDPNLGTNENRFDNDENEEVEDNLEYNKLQQMYLEYGWDESDEDEDDANPPSTISPNLNLLQLLNQARDLGARMALRQVRRNLLAQARLRGQLEDIDTDRVNCDPQNSLASDEMVVSDDWFNDLLLLLLV